MDVAFLIEFGGNPQSLCPGANTGNSRISRLLHHITQRACQLNFACTGHHRHLNRQQLSAYTGPGQPVDQSYYILLGCIVPGILSGSQQLLQVIRLHRKTGECLVRNNLLSGLPADRGNHPLQCPHTGLTSITVHQQTQSLLGEFQLRSLDAVLFQLLLHQMPGGNLQLLLQGVAAQLNHIHPVI